MKINKTVAGPKINFGKLFEKVYGGCCCKMVAGLQEPAGGCCEMVAGLQEPAGGCC